MRKNDLAKIYQIAEKIDSLDSIQWEQLLSTLEKEPDKRIIKILKDAPEELDLRSGRNHRKSYIS